ncbi:28s ribosomal protein s26 mitochondrial [Holotrichia oblita]|uniref:28s ribosomal protein s26 mitochondrial n=2 Tax=Holotrichia oblita TaxID=644536 RepID=A0ACB9TC34_HOLOL|nr:28s ribosomal protein s26 mitochondrial [Holotrichia oblita]KAI4464433.1 28s ribosomal protein s26 mitochondrial [Holotrichia oblita]
MFALNVISKTLNLPATKSAVNFQILRWRRKPRWVPIAKSKQFRIPQRPVIIEDEQIELKRLFNNYRTQMKSIKRYIVERFVAARAITTDPKDIQRIFDEDFARCNKINDEWNSDIQSKRIEYFENTLEENINLAKESLQKRLELEQFKLEEAEKIVTEQKELSKTFITADNIDEAIERSLANPVDYNFAVDLDGNKFYNKKTL